MLVSSVISELFNPYRRTILLSWALIALNACYLICYGEPLINEGILFSIVSLISWAAIIHFIYHVLEEFCSILDIYVFTIKHKSTTEIEKKL